MIQNRFTVEPCAPERFRVIDARAEHRYPEMSCAEAERAAASLNDAWNRFESHCRRFHELVDAREARLS
jgi:hypothetical protein